MVTTTGHYMYIETSAPRKKGDIATLMSTWFNVTGAECTVRFYTHMTGTGIGELNIWVQKEDGTKTRKLHLTERKSFICLPAAMFIVLLFMSFHAIVSIATSTDIWKAQTVLLGDLTDRFRLLFEGIRGDTHEGDVAIDDINFEKCGDGKYCYTPSGSHVIPGHMSHC